MSKPADPMPVRHQIEEFLRTGIVSGRFAPGERLRERELVQLLRVSRTSLREGLRQIEAEGLIVVTPNKGPVVNTLTYEEAEEIYEVRALLEAHACSGFAERASGSHLAALKALFGQMKDASRRGEVADLLMLKRGFYDVIIAGCGNRFVGQLLKQMHNRIMLLRRTSMSEPTRIPDMIEEIEILVTALVARDAKAASAASAHHIRQAGRVALKVLRERQWQVTSRRAVDRRRQAKSAA